MYKFSLLFLFLFCSTVKAQSADPTKPLNIMNSSVTNVTQKDALNLQTIVANGENKSVVINGQLLNIGDQIQQYKLSKITRNYVVLSSLEKDMTLSLFKSVVVKTK